MTFEELEELLGDQGDLDYYAERAEIDELLSGEDLPEVEFEPYDDEGNTITKRGER